jgi:hypothetical protein
MVKNHSMLAQLAPKALGVCLGKKVGQQMDDFVLKDGLNYVLVAIDVGLVSDKIGIDLQILGSQGKGGCVDGGNLKHDNYKV